MFQNKFAAKKEAKRGGLQSLDDLTIDKSAQAQPEIAPPLAISVNNQQIVLELDPSECYTLDQVRSFFSKEEINDRAASMKQYGQLTPINVRPKDHTGKYLILNGESRWRAAQTIPGFKLKAIVIPRLESHNDNDEIILQLIENVQRSDLQPLEIARGCARLRDKKMSLKDIASRIGWTKGTSQEPNIDKVSRYLSLLELPEEGQQLVEQGIVVDIDTLIYLRKIEDLDPHTFALLCEAARREDGLTRSRAKSEYEKLKKPAAQDQQEPIQDHGDTDYSDDIDSDEEPLRAVDWKTDFAFEDNADVSNTARPSPGKSSESSSPNPVPVVKIKVNGQSGVLVLTPADRKGLLTVEINGQRMRVKAADITITTVS